LAFLFGDGTLTSASGLLGLAIFAIVLLPPY
jgi:hypothetical protein